MIEPLSRRNHALLRSLFSRHGRKKSEFCVCEGVKACKELLQIAPEKAEFAVKSDRFPRDSFDSLPIFQLSESEFSKISPMSNSEGILIVAKAPDDHCGPIETEGLTIFLDRISDPGNIGTIIRTARAAGLQELWIGEGSADPFSSKAIRAAMASQFALRIRRFPDAESAVCEFRRNPSAKIYLSNPHKGANCFTEKGIFENSMIIFGNEANGSEIGSASVIDLTIPMPGAIESINVAQAFTVIVFEYLRRVKFSNTEERI